MVAACWVVARNALPGRVLALPRGYSLTYDRMSYGAGVLELDGARVAAPGGALTIEAQRVTIDRLGLGAMFGAVGPLDVTLTAPALRASASAGDVAGAVRAVASWQRWTPGLQVRIVDGSAQIAGPSGSTSATFDHTIGSLSVVGRGLAYDVRTICEDGGQAYPLLGTAARDDRGVVRHHWTAGALPLTTVLALLAPPSLLARRGTLRDVDLTFAEGAATPAMRVGAHLVDGDFVLGSSPHAIRGLHGDLTIVDDGIAAKRLSGSIDASPLDISGEVDDLHGAPFRWLVDGTDDLRALTSLLAKVAAEPVVRGVRLESVAPGIAFAQYTTQVPYGPLVVSAVAIDPREPTVRFDTVLANDRITSGGERITAMGVRTGAVVGINGDYYDIGRSWAPQGVVIHDGTLLRTPIERMALTIHRDKRVTFQEYQLRGSAHVGRATLPLTQLNDWPAGDVTFLTPEYGDIPPAPGVVLAQLAPLDRGLRRFRVTSVGPATSKTAATFALAFGPLVHAPPLRAGEHVEVEYGLRPAADDAIAAIGGGPQLLRGGAWYEDPHPPAPDERTVHWAVVAVGRMADDSLMIFQVDGRHPERSVGMTRPDFAELMRRFGVIDAMALDSGGSSTIVSRAPGDPTVTLRNHPSDDDGERWVSNGFFVYSSAPPGTLLQATTPRDADPPVR